MNARGGLTWLVVVLVASAGCDTPPPDTPTPSPSPTAAATTPTSEPATGTTAPTRTTAPTGTPSLREGGGVVTLARTGGFAGESVNIKVQPDGRWRVDNGQRTERTGVLGAAQLSRLRSLAADPRLAAEAAGSMSQPPRCADAFMYLLIVDYQLIKYEQCPSSDDPPAVTTEIIELLEGATSG